MADADAEACAVAAYLSSVIYLRISREVSFHACRRSSFNSKTVDSQSLASEKGVSFILLSFRSISGSADAALPALGDLDLDPDLPDLPDMAS